MLLIDEMCRALRRGGPQGNLGLVCITNGGANFLGRVADETSAAMLARKVGAKYPAKETPEFVLHRHNGLSGWSEGTEVVCRFDRHGKRLS